MKFSVLFLVGALAALANAAAIALPAEILEKRCTASMFFSDSESDPSV